MELGEKIKEITGINEKLVDKYLMLNMLGTTLNAWEDMIEEINEADVQVKFNELQDLINTKREKLWKTTLES